MNRRALTDMLLKHEGVRLKPYRDTVGKLTIGCGRNLDDKGITQDEASFMLENDILETMKACTTRIACFGSLDDARQVALCDMAFNLGIGGLLKFSQMLSALEARDFERAAAEMLSSQWAQQVGNRATELAAIMRTGMLA